jgi:hypothetical protein
MTQKQAAEELGCTTRTVQKAETRINYDNIIDNSCSPAEPPPPPTESRGNTQDYLLRRVADKAPELIPEIGKGKKFKYCRENAYP